MTRRRGSAAEGEDGGEPTMATPAVVRWDPPSPAGTPAAPAPVAGRSRAATRTEKGPGRIRARVLPRSVLGIASLILAFAIGCGFSGVILFSYYQYKLNQTDNRVNTLITGYKTEFTNAENNLKAIAATANAGNTSQQHAGQGSASDPATVAALVKKLAPSMFFVHTLDANGQPSVGTAFVISSTSKQSLLLTSYTTVQAATRSPGPTVLVRQGATDARVTVRSWDPQYDLALLILDRGGLPPVTPAPLSPAPLPGDPIYAMSGLGSAGASVDSGTLVDVFASGVAEDAAIGPAFQGGPLVNRAGQVLAVASRTYAPLGFASSGVWYSPYVQAACNKVLTCSGGTLAGGG